MKSLFFHVYFKEIKKLFSIFPCENFIMKYYTWNLKIVGTLKTVIMTVEKF